MIFRSLLAAAAAAAPSQPLEFQGVALGTPLQAWLQRPLDDPGRPGLRAVCRRSAGAAAATVCRYVGRYGAVTVGESFPLAGRYRARDVAYRFVGGRLAEVDFSTSADAFNLMMARLKQRYGQPAQVVRGTASYGHGVRLPRVRVVWRLPAGEVELTDPSADPGRMAVRLRGASVQARAAS